MKFTLGKKLGLGFGAILAMMLFNTSMSYLKSAQISKTDDFTFEVRIPQNEVIRKLLGDVNQTQSKGRQVLLAGTQTIRREEARKLYEAAWNAIDKDIVDLDQMAPRWSLQENRDRLAEIKRQLPQLRSVQETAMGHAADGTRDAVLNAGNEFADKATTSSEAIKSTVTAMEESFAMLLEKTKESSHAENRSLTLTTILTTCLALGIGTLVAFFLIRGVTAGVEREKLAAAEIAQAAEREKLAAQELGKKVDSILSVVSAAGHGDLTHEISVRGSDAIGQMGEGLGKFFADLRQSIGSIGASALSLASASEELTTVSHQMSANAEETSAQTKVVSGATLQVSQNLQTVATGAEEMGASIKEIAKNATEAAKIANSAVRAAETANSTVSKLGDSSAEIGQVIKVITSIAQQTNLLALNATIEAARAGEAGKGFAVVANEVKELAKKTAKATEDISRKIETIQVDAKAAVDSIGTISEVINQINGISNTIATAVEEQNATTNEMARNVSEAAHGSGEITSNIAGVAEAADSTSRGASDTQKAAQQLVETSAELRRLVEQFKIDESGSERGARPQQPHSKGARAGA